VVALGPAPPAELRRRPHRYLLPARSMLWRIHSARRTVTGFRPPSDPGAPGGGRFDTTRPDEGGVLYCSEDRSTALVERLLRSQKFDGRGDRLLGEQLFAGRRVSMLQTTTELVLITLVSATDLAAVGQNDWLVQAEPHQFARTQEWARWLRSIEQSAQGLVWQSRRDRPGRAIVLFGDRCPAGALAAVPHSEFDLDSDTGREHLRWLLRPYYVTIPGKPG